MADRTWRSTLHVAALSAGGLLAIGGAHARAQTADDLFDGGALHEIRLQLNSRDLQTIRERFAEDIYYPADLEWRGMRVRNVALRSRGLGSRSSTKLGLRIDSNRYVRGQTFLGLSSIVLDNLWQDASLVRERVAMALFARMGQPASRESFCRLYINGVYQGVYAIVESVNTDFTRRVFDDGAGYLFEYRWSRPYYFEAIGEDLNAYKPMFTPQSRETEGDNVLYAPIREMIRAINDPDDAVWRTRVEQYVDLPQFVIQVAIQTFLGEYDGLIGIEGTNNFYLYRSAGTNIHRFIVWDLDNALRIEAPILDRVHDFVLLRRALQFADLRELYLGSLEQAARLAANDNWLMNEVERSVSLIGDAAREDTRKPYTHEEWVQEVVFIRDFVRRRPQDVLQQVAAIRAAGQ